MSDLEIADTSNSNKHALGVVFVLAMMAGTAFFFGFVPNTEAYQTRVAKDVVSQMMIDPAAAKFGSVTVFRNAAGQFVCGGVNGKNRMGAYSGEVRFISNVETESATLDPQITTTASDLDQARLSCAEMKASEYASQSTVDSICTNASEYARDVAQQALFENEWNLQCR